MKRITYSLLSVVLLSVSSLSAQCPPLSFDAINTGSNMTLFLTNGSLLSDLGNGTIGVYYTDADGHAVCAGSAAYTGNQVQISAYGDDTTTPEKDGFSANEAVVWKFESADGSQYDLTPSPQDAYSTNATSFVNGMANEAIVCSDNDAICPPLAFDAINTGSNMTLFLTNGSLLSDLGNGTIGVYYTDADGHAVCAGSSAYTGNQVQISAYGDDTTTPEKDGFSANEAVVWKFESTDGSKYDLTPTPLDVYSTNATSFVIGMANEAIVCSDNDDACPPLSFDALNTGSNMTLFLTNGSLLSDLGNGTIGVYYTDADGHAVCAGSTAYTGNQVQISAYGDDTTTPEKDGFSANEAVVWKFESTDGSQYDLTPTPQDAYSTNATSFVIGMANEAIVCSSDLEGCTDSDYVEYNSQATIDNGSCSTLKVQGCTNAAYLEYNSNANTNDGSCVTLIFEGCTDEAYTEFNPYANTDNGSCSTLKVQGCTDDAYLEYNSNANTNDGSCVTLIVEGCTDDGYSEFNPDANVDNGSCLTLVVEGCTDDAYLEYISNANTNDGSCLTLIVEGCTDDGYEEFIPDANVDNGSCLLLIVLGCTDVSSSNYNEDATENDASCISWEQAYITCTELGGDDGITQADVDAQADLSYGYGYGAGVASVVPEDGITQADVDAVQSQLEDAQLSNLQIQALLDEALANSGGACDPIYVDLLSGWNIIGYTLSFEQDVVASLLDIVNQVQIVKNNAANVYWPEFGFNGIGNFIPGQGYQIRMFTALEDYTFPDVNDERIYLSPSVPNYVYDLPILTHPNDIKTLVKVVNMLGQEVGAERQFKGDVLLYLYNDGSVEKRMVE
jgi:ligand-binding SRPBCC domain-containing protein